MLLAVGLAEERGSWEDVPSQTDLGCVPLTRSFSLLPNKKRKENICCPVQQGGKKKGKTALGIFFHEGTNGRHVQEWGFGLHDKPASGCPTASGLLSIPTSPSCLPRLDSLKTPSAPTLQVYPGLSKLLWQEQHSLTYLCLP